MNNNTNAMSNAFGKPRFLKEFCQKKIAKNTDKKYTSVFTNSAVYGVIKQKEYFENDVANSDNIDAYYIVAPRDFIYNPRISENAPYGPIRANETGETGVVSPLYFVFGINDYTNVNYSFLKYYFASTAWHRYIYSVGNNGARNDRMNIVDADIMNMPVALPPLAEQQKIAQILECCDKVIRFKRELLAEKKKQKKSLMQKLLNPDSGFRLPGFSGAWKKSSLGELCQTFSGGTPSRDSRDYFSGNIPWLKSGELNNRIITKTEESITQSALDNSSAKIVKAGTLLLALYGATAGIIAITKIDVAISQAILAIENNDILDTQFLYFSLLNQIDIAIKKYTQGGQPNFNAGIIRALPISYPALEKQQAIAKILSAADHEIDLLEQDLAQYEQKKKSLMQLLLTGKVRV